MGVVMVVNMEDVDPGESGFQRRGRSAGVPIGTKRSSQSERANSRAQHSSQIMFSLTRRLLPTAYSTRAFSVTALKRNGATLPPQDSLEGEQLIIQKLVEKFAPSQLQVQDVSGTSLLCIYEFGANVVLLRWMWLVLFHNYCERNFQGTFHCEAT